MPFNKSAALLVGVSLLLLPQAALAHGLVGRRDLPVPTWLFAWAAVIVLIISFIALALAWKSSRYTSYSWRAIPAALSNLLTHSTTQIATGTVASILLFVTVLSGLSGNQNPLDNFAPTFIYVIFWVGLVPLSILCGDVFKAFNPWRAVARFFRNFVEALSGKPLRAPLTYPNWLGHWPAALTIFAFAWLELAFVSRDDPSQLAIFTLIYTAFTLVMMSLFGIEKWLARGEGFSVYFNLFSRLSIWERRGDRIGVRPPLSGLGSFKALSGTVGLLTVMIGTVAFDGASEGGLWTGIGPELTDLFGKLGFGLNSSIEISFTIGTVAGVAAVAGFYFAGIYGARSVGGGFRVRELARAFCASLVPISAAYVLAHYISLLAYQGQSIVFLLSDPMGRGADIFGTAGGKVDYGVLSATDIWYVQVGFLIVGHICGLVLAHDRALTLYRDEKTATRSQYWMLFVMVGFTSLGLWLLSEANG